MAIKCPKCHFDNPEDTVYCGKCATPLHPSEGISISQTETLETPREELTTGTTFAGRYQIIEELGKGGMGKVYRVLDKKLNEEVALKLIKPEIAFDKNTLERFQNELKLARKISHRNIGRMYELMEEKGIHFITMEYVAGEDLKSFIRRSRQLTVGTAVTLAKQVCEGLAEAHRLGVIHRDLKPSNVIIDKEGNARIMDFGIARSIKTKGITGAGVMIGTPEYMSPEQVEGKEVDQRSDIYSLGIILYEMLTGRVPFEGDTPFTIGVKQKSEMPKNPKEFNAQIPAGLSQLIMKCLEKDKEKRYQTTDEVHSELEKIEKGIPTTEREIPKRKPLTSKEITVKFQLKKLFIPALGVIALAIIALVIIRFLPKHHITPPPSGKPSLAILYFENISGDKNLDAWKTGLSELLITKLGQSRFINVLDGNTVYSILKKLNLDEAKKYTKEDLIKVANEGGATHTISGSIMKAEQNIIITLTLQRPHTGEVISSMPIECNGEKEIMAKVDEVATKIKSDLNLSPEQIAGDIDKEMSKITTSSAEAYKFYSQGREFHKKGEYEQGIALIEKAIALDPGFAMAYRSLGASYGNLGYSAKSKEYRQKAFELSDRVSDRERYLIHGFFYESSEKTLNKAIDAYTKLLDFYPDDITGHINLGNIYSSIEEWDKAIEQHEANTRRKIPGIICYENLAGEYESKGLYEKAREIIEDYAKNFSDNAVLRQDIAYNYLCQGKYDLALNEANKAFSLAPMDSFNILLSGEIYLLKGDLIEAEKNYQKLVESGKTNYVMFGKRGLSTLFLLEGKFGKSKEQIQQGLEKSNQAGEPEWEASFHDLLGYLLLKAGDFAAALKEFDKAWNRGVEADSLEWQRIALWKKGLAYLGMNSIQKAQKTADELKEFIEKGISRKKIRYYHHLQGNIELEKKNYAKAIEYLEKAVTSLPAQYDGSNWDALFYDTLASAHFKAGDLENAQKDYETIISLTWGRLSWGDIYAKSFYMLGKIAEQQGQKAKAKEHYQKFFDLWKDADPGLPEIADAKKRLSSL